MTARPHEPTPCASAPLERPLLDEPAPRAALVFLTTTAESRDVAVAVLWAALAFALGLGVTVARWFS